MLLGAVALAAAGSGAVAVAAGSTVAAAPSPEPGTVPAVAAPSAGGQEADPPRDDEVYTGQIRKFTTAPFFLTPLVETIPASDAVPSPLDHLGYIPGAEGRLTYAADVHAYMRALASASPRVALFTLGTSEEGRERLLVAVSSAGTIGSLDRHRRATARLADPRGLADGEARELIEDGKAVYWAIGGLHSPETGSPEMLMELAYRLAVEERPLFRRVRDEVITLITPVIEVDGRERIIDVMRYREARPDRTPPPLVYWGKYVAHDNNRDGIGLGLSLSRQVIDAYMGWHPQVMHDLHESVPYLYIMSGRGPYNAWIDPITTEEWVEMAWTEVRQMNEWNVPGVWTHDFFDGWAANYMISTALGRNSIGRFYETFGNSVPDTLKRETEGTSRRAWFRMNPTFPEVRWSLRNNTNLMQSALLVGLDNVARNRERFLETFWRKSARAVDKPRREGPAAWVIPSGGERARLAARLVRLLQEHRMEIHRLSEPVTLEGLRVAAGASPDAYREAELGRGDWVVRMDQPHSRLADMLLDYQFYSAADPPPYDDTGWTLGPLFNVPTWRVEDTAILDAGMDRVEGEVRIEGRVAEPGTAERPLDREADGGAAGSDRGGAPGPGDASVPADGFLLIPATGEPEIAQLRYRLAEVHVRAAEGTIALDDRELPAGTLIVDLADLGGDDRERLGAQVERLGLEGLLTTEAPEVSTHPVPAPRIALMHTWIDTQSEGWYRLAFDDLGIPYDYVSVQDVRDTPDLRSRWDVVLLAPTYGGMNRIVHGFPAADPIPWETTELTPHLGRIDSTPDMRRGLGYEGMAHLRRFVEEGGLFVALAGSSSFAIDAGLAPSVTGDSPPRDLNARGGVYRAAVADAGSPIVYGYPDTLGVYFSRAPLLRVSVRGGRFGFGGGEPPAASGRRGRDLVPGRKPFDEIARDQGWKTVEERDDDATTAAGEDPEASAEGDGGDGERDVAGEGGGAEDERSDRGRATPADVDERWTDTDEIDALARIRAGHLIPPEERYPRIVMRFAGRPGDLLVSGLLGDGSALAARPAIVDVPVGDGHVVLFAINPVWRNQTWGQFGLLFNTILHYDSLDAGRPAP